jgi:hypothetical protein
MSVAPELPITFITSAYGDRYAPFLLVTLESLRKSYSGEDVRVYWQDISPEKIGLLMKGFPEYRFIETHLDIKGDIAQKISSKVRLWYQAVCDAPDGPTCLLDSDVLVLRDFSHFFGEATDIVFTDKLGLFPLNTGVMLVNNSARVRIFMEDWLKKTLEIIRSPEQLAVATSINYPYGGADQMAFHLMLHYQPGQYEYSFLTDEGEVVLQSVPCELLNETRSTPLTKHHHIIHYKGGWRNIILRGDSFTRNRPKADSIEMYCLFLQTYLEATSRLDDLSPLSASETLPIVIPFYLDIRSMSERPGMYLIFYIWAYGKKFLRKIFSFFQLAAL